MKHMIKSTLAISLLAIAAHANAAPTTPSTNPTITLASATDNISPAERTKIENVVHQYLLKKPEVLVEALQIMQQRQMEEAKLTVKQTQQVAPSFAKDLFHQANDPFVGNPNGKVTVVEFFDYQCPHCVDMAPVIEGIVKANPNLRIVFKEFPIRGPMSETAARAALAANLQGKYAAFSHALLTSKQIPLTEDIIFQTAKSNGLDVEKLKKDMNSPTVDKQLKNNLKLAQDLKLFGTPALFIANTDTNKTGAINYVPGQADQNQLQGFIDQASK